MNKNYSGSLALTKLKHVPLEMDGKDGKVLGLFIPIEANYLVKGKEDEDGDAPYYLPIRVITREEPDKYKQNGFVSQSVDSKVYKAATDEEKEKFNELPILGNIKDFTSGASSDDNAGKAETGEKKVLNPKDKVPF